MEMKTPIDQLTLETIDALRANFDVGTLTTLKYDVYRWANATDQQIADVLLPFLRLAQARPES